MAYSVIRINSDNLARTLTIWKHPPFKPHLLQSSPMDLNFKLLRYV